MASYNLTITKSGYNSVTCGITCDTTNNVCMNLSCVAPGGCSISGTTSTSSSGCSYSSGQTLTLKAVSTSGDAVTAWNWSTSDSSVCTVSNGSDTVTVTFKKAGSATISCVMGNSCGACNPGVTVSNSFTQCSAPTSVSISGNSSTSSSSCTYSSGQTITVTGSYAGSSCYGVSTSWSSSDTSIATVKIKKSGAVVTFKKTGTVTITYTASNSCGSKSATKSVSNSWTQLTAPTVSSVSASNWSSSGCGNFPGCTVTATASYTDGTGSGNSGSWSIVSGSAGTVNSSGVITFSSTGTVTVRYTRSNDCGSDYAQTSVSASWTKLTAPTVSSVSASNWSSSGCGNFPGCTVQATASYSEGTGGNKSGSWSIVSGSAGTVNSSGVITFSSTGTVTVRYTRSNDCGSDYAQTSVSASWTKLTAPTVSSVSASNWSSSGCGNFPGCTVQATASYSEGTGGNKSGSWSIVSGSAGTVNSSGVITFTSTGTVTVRYTRSNDCGSDYAQKSVSASWTKLTAPSVSSVSASNWSSSGCGNFPGCTVQATASYSEGTGGNKSGSWSIVSGSAGTVNSSGVITFSSTGTVTVRYTRSNDCGSDYAQTSVSASWTKLTAPTVSSVSASNWSSCGCGGFPGCTVQATANYTEGTGGNKSGTWSIVSGSAASVNGSGLLTFTSTGTVTVRYTRSNDCGSASAQTSVSASWCDDDGPYNLSISGTKTTGYTGCTYSSGQTLSLSGSYTNGCCSSASYIAWSSSDESVCTVSNGTVTFKKAGNATIYYKVGNSCATATTSANVSNSFTQLTAPTVNSVTGNDCVCLGNTTTFSESHSDGTGAGNTGAWSSSNTGVATVNASGVVTGVAAGTATIRYTRSNNCGSSYKEKSITVYKKSSSISISGGGVRVNAGSGVTLTGTSPQNSAATTTWQITSGTGTLSVSTGTSTVAKVTNTNSSITVKYTVTEPCSCGTVTASTTIYSYGQISDGVSVSCSGGGTICCGSTATIVGTITNNVNASLTRTYSSNNTNLPVNSSNGVVSGNAANQSGTITCTVTDSYGNSTTCTQTVKTYPSVASVSISGGGGSTCCGSTVTLTGSYTSGISLKNFSWSSNNGNVVLQSGSSAGSAVFKFNAASQTATITYSVTSCDNVTKTTTTTVYSYPSVASVSISGGGTTACCGGTISLTGSYTSGISLKSFEWTSNNTNVVLQAGSTATSSTFKFNAAGQTATITYKITSCDNVSKTTTTTIYSYPSVASASISGGGVTLCTGGTVTLTGSYTSGISLKSVSWSTSNANFTLSNTGNTTATVTATSGANGSSTTISYVVTSCDNISKTGTTTIYCYKNLASTSLGNPSNYVIYGGGSCKTSTIDYSYSPTDMSRGSDSLTLSNTAVASISYPAGTSGTATITGIQNVNAASSVDVTITYTVTDVCNHSLTKTKTITVRQHVTAATLDITSRTLCAGANETGYNSDVTLTAGFAPANAYGVSYSWATSDSSVASISTTAGGTTTVHGIKKGTATITLTATDGCGTSVTKTCSITVKNPNLTCLSASNITVTCGSTATYTVEASPRKNVGNETTESIVNVTGWTATVTNGVDNVLGQGKINIAKSDKSGTFKGLTHGTGTTITITGQTVGLSDVTVTAVDDNGVSKTIVFRVLTKSTAQDDTTKIATRGWINTYRWPIFGSGEDLKKVPRKVDITNAVASGTVSGYLTISGTYENTQGVKESDLSVSMSSNNGKPSGDKC